MRTSRGSSRRAFSTSKASDGAPKCPQRTGLARRRQVRGARPACEPRRDCAVIPYIAQPIWHLGPLTVAAFGLLVAASVMVGLLLGRHRFRTMGLDVAVGEALAWRVLIGGFVAAHVFSVLLYFPEKVRSNPLVLFAFWEDISSFGGILGGVIALWWWFRGRGAMLPRAERWAYVDAVAFVFPVGLMVGRLACTVAHDHPGRVTAFPLAISLATPDAQAFIGDVYASAGRASELPAADRLDTLGFHDLGFYEFLYLAAVVVPVTVWLGRRRAAPASGRRPAFVVSFLVLYMPVRFALDFLRVSDVRYAGLTPAQWSALVALAALPVLWYRTRLAPESAGAQG